MYNCSNPSLPLPQTLWDKSPYSRSSGPAFHLHGHGDLGFMMPGLPSWIPGQLEGLQTTKTLLGGPWWHLVSHATSTGLTQVHIMVVMRPVFISLKMFTACAMLVCCAIKILDWLISCQSLSHCFLLSRKWKEHWQFSLVNPLKLQLMSLLNDHVVNVDPPAAFSVKPTYRQTRQPPRVVAHTGKQDGEKDLITTTIIIIIRIIIIIDPKTIIFFNEW